MAILGNTQTTLHSYREIYSSGGGNMHAVCQINGAYIPDCYVTSMSVRINPDYSTGTIYGGIYDESTLTLITNGKTNGTVLDGTSVYKWFTLTWSTPPVITAGTSIYLVVGSSDSVRARVLTSLYPDPTYLGEGYGWFSVVGSVIPNSMSTPNTTVDDNAIYMNFNVGPLLKIEGITPDKLEYVDYSDIDDVY